MQINPTNKLTLFLYSLLMLFVYKLFSFFQLLRIKIYVFYYTKNYSNYTNLLIANFSFIVRNRRLIAYFQKDYIFQSIKTTLRILK